MRRKIEEELCAWKGYPRRMPLLVRGARQVGKTYVIEAFGREEFDSLVTINFERQPSLKRAFEDLDPRKIVARLEAMTGKRIVVGSTLLFFDEIQACPRAITALRYFKEELADLHVIGAGSLLEFALEEEQISFPVGRVQYLYMQPLRFGEFLTALGEQPLLEQLEQVTLADPPSSGVHEHALELVRQYLLLGGMPAVVSAFCETGSFEEAWHIQQGLMQTFQDDFGKYAKRTQHKYLELLFERAPYLVGHHFQYSKIDPQTRSRDLKAALDQLCKAGLTVRIHPTRANGIPLRAEINQRKFKLLFLDVGLLQRSFQVDPHRVFEQELLQINNGQLAEQFVGQELIAAGNPYEERRLFFWERSTGGNAAEIDYVVRIDSEVVPIEVKAGATGRLRSLQRFLELKNRPVGVRISQHPLALRGNILSVPLYLVGCLGVLMKRLKERP